MDADGLALALAGAGIGVGALSTDREALAVTQAAVAVDLLEALQIDLDVPAQVAFNDVIVGLDIGDDGSELLVGEFAGAGVRIDAELAEDLFGEAGADAVDVGERSFDALFVRDINTKKTGHIRR